MSSSVYTTMHQNTTPRIVVMILISVTLSSSSLSPVIVIPGNAGNQLEARLDKPSNPSSTCPTKTCSWYRLWMDMWQLKKDKIGCWTENMKLVYNKAAGTCSNVEGVFTRVPGWGDTSSMEYIDPSWSAWAAGDAGNYLHDMLEFLVKQGYTRGSNLRGAPYDFRFAPHSQETFFQMLKLLIEESYLSNNETPVTIISHSMGGLFAIHFFHQQSQAWLDQYVHHFIPINTPWTGVVLQLNTYASGYNMDISLIDPLVLRESQRSFETSVYLLPLPTTWPDKTRVLVSTPAKNYTVQDYPAFFKDIGFPEGWDMMLDILNLTPLRHPRVRTSCMYSLGVDTPVGFVYGAGFPDKQPRKILGDGDGTVSRESAEACRNFLTGAEDSVIVVKSTNHGDILKHQDVFSFIASNIYT